ncbi:ATP-binding cassette domain-containing protein [Roseibium suaedae]|uniref:ABC-type bacteriocin/lantibiotic exporter, contains an N-terminal double-glycine peptidase domain n=1 Tax=Roseibium suaedae TaxID=735517 RepID=A0A1M7I122_9HYPH|nr:ABC transporter transmembrane domain-containing protein [Roseibium suaedae]SHM34410.1 ABC-type bacteriocin/lantibiotic exporter, contains an N-terminal double-glycine peptidase domain [Roseibium suaedae]
MRSQVGGTSQAASTPVMSLLSLTMALNLLGLSVPIAAQLVFNRILPSPDAPTLPLIVGGVVIAAMLEAILRFTRSFIILENRRIFSTSITRQLMSRILTTNFEAGERGAAQSLDYFNSISQVSDKYAGQSLVAVAELFFLPVILIVMLYISPVAGLLVVLCLLGGISMILHNGTRMQKSSLVLKRFTERRYRFLLMVLHAIHPLKALAIERQVLRTYEAIQGEIARTSLISAKAAARLMNGTLITNQIIVAVCLVYGAFAVSQGIMTLGAVSAIVLLGGRLAAPMQRAVFIFIQSKDLCQAEDTLNAMFKEQPRRPLIKQKERSNQGHIQVQDLEFTVGGLRDKEVYRYIDLELLPGETAHIEGKNPAAVSKLLRLLAGVEDPDAGTILLNEQDIRTFSQVDLNHSAVYVSGNSPMFHGTIRDNITRFGQVTLDDAMEVAVMMGIQDLISELPKGVDTELTGMADENVPAGLCQQLAILRSVVKRPRLIMLDNIDRGLDRQSYGRLQKFLSLIQGQATMLVASSDLNMTASAQKRFVLSLGGLKEHQLGVSRKLVPYRSLKL